MPTTNDLHRKISWKILTCKKQEVNTLTLDDREDNNCIKFQDMYPHPDINFIGSRSYMLTCISDNAREIINNCIIEKNKFSATIVHNGSTYKAECCYILRLPSIQEDNVNIEIMSLD